MKDSVTRFTPSERWLHNVVMFTVLALLVTGVGMIYFNVQGDQSGPRLLLVRAHQYVSVIFLVAPLLLVMMGNKGVWKENLRLLTTWGWKDFEWLMKKPVSALFGNIHLPPADKFNPGQKTWATLAVAGSKALAVTGLIMWSVPSPILAIMIHTAVGVGLGLALLGHVFMAVGNKDTRPSITSIIHGKVDAKWAAHHHPLWMERQSRRRVDERPEFAVVHRHAGYVTGKS
ncbi:MAG: cytochrome b/b6 domain-containing protein [Nitrospinae bacterium]|nr:cytochrome b/b6 domain-containing protein [Nitrospinota bacterium]